MQFNPLLRKFASEKALEKLHGKPWPVYSFWVAKAIFGTMLHIAKILQRYRIERKFDVEGAEIVYPHEILGTRYFKLFGMRGRIY